MRILILHDEAPAEAGRADEHDGLAQAAEIRAALESAGHTVSSLACGLDLAGAAAAIRAAAPDLVFNLVESVSGTGRLIHFAPCLLDSLGIPYTGCPADAVYETSNKLIAKRTLAGAGLPTPGRLTLPDLRRRGPFTPGRYIIKSVWEHASVGLDEDSVVHAGTAADLATAIERRLPALLGEGFAEAYIDGREFNLALLADPRTGRPGVLPPAEIEFVGYGREKPRVVGYRAKWDESAPEYHSTPRRFDFPAADRPLLGDLSRLAVACWDLFNLRGYARVDFRVDPQGHPWILEVNTNPCLSADAGFAAALARAGLTLGDALARILADANRPGRSTRA